MGKILCNMFVYDCIAVVVICCLKTLARVLRSCEGWSRCPLQLYSANIREQNQLAGHFKPFPFRLPFESLLVQDPQLP